jgi:hypothetical protein
MKPTLVDRSICSRSPKCGKTLLVLWSLSCDSTVNQRTLTAESDSDQETATHDPYPCFFGDKQTAPQNQFFIEITAQKSAAGATLSPTHHVHARAQALTSHSVTPHPHSHALLPPPCFVVVIPALLLPPPPLPLLLHWSCSLAPLLCLSLSTFFFLRFTFFCPCLFSAQPPRPSPASLTRRLQRQ